MENISGKRKTGRLKGQRSGHILKSRRGFGFSVHTAKARPSNTAVRGPSGNEASTEVVLSFLRGTVKAMVLDTKQPKVSYAKDFF